MSERASLFPFTLELDEYEASNLEEGLVTLRRLSCDTGDWLGQILNRLPKTEYVPNVYVDGQVKRALLSKPVKEEVAALREALAWYAEPRNYLPAGGEHHYDALVSRDAYDSVGPGARARSALGIPHGGASDAAA